MPLYLSSNSKAVGAAQFQPSPLAREFIPRILYCKQNSLK